MSEFLVNLVRRGAGLAPEMSPRPIARPDSSAPLAQPHHGGTEKGLESDAEDRLERTEKRETSRSMMVQWLPAPASSICAGLPPRYVEASSPHRDPLSSAVVSVPISTREEASRSGPRPDWTVTPRPEEEPREHRFHGPSRLDTFQAVERDALRNQDDTSRRRGENPPATPVEKQERGAFTAWRAESDELLSRRDMASAPGSRGDGLPRDSFAFREEAGRVSPRQELSWDPGLPPVRMSPPQAAPGADASTIRVQVRIGRIEVRVVRPPAQATPPPAHTPGGFAEYTLARRYLDRVWY